MKNDISVEDIYKILEKDDKYHLKNLINSPVPINDYEYLNLWFSYLALILDETDLIGGFIANWSADPENFKYKYKLMDLVKKNAEIIFKEKIAKVGFLPRIEKYIQKFDEHDRDSIKRIVLSVFYHFSESPYSTSRNLLEFAKRYDLNMSFIYSFTADHALLKDKVIYLDEGILQENKPLLQKDVYYKSAIYKIFAGLKLTDSDIASISDSPLLLDFNLISSEYFLENQTLIDEETKSEVQEEVFDSIEDLLRQTDEPVGFDVPTIDEKIIPDLDEEHSAIIPFSDDLDYLFEESKWIILLFALRELQNEESSYRRQKEENTFELEQQLRRQKNLCRIRLKKTRLNGFIPRVERIASKLKLNDFEKNVLKLLTIEKIFPNEKMRSNSPIGRTFKVGDLLFLFVDDAKTRVKEKKVFLRNSKLVKYNLIQVSRSNYLDESIQEASVSIDNRLLEFLGGEDFEFSDYFEGGILYKSKIKFDSVILSETKKTKIIEIIDNFPLFLKAKKNLDFSDIVNYGNSLVMLFVGPSGTGKTMTANAIADYLNKKILTINLNQGISVHDNYRSNTSSVLSLIFREARINDAILFFDESEVLLSSRLPDILLEIEKHEGVVIFATNASFIIDEAMRRRINLIVDYEEPGPSIRKRIWEIHLPKKIKLDKDVDLDFIAKKYELNGGLIKNAVFSALAYAVNQGKEKELEIKLEHLEYGAREQLQNKLFMSRLEEKRIPLRGLDSLVLPQNTLDTIKEIVNFEKAKKVLDGEWGFKDVFPESSGMTVLFHGVSGTGKTITAEAIAFETGKTLRIVNYAQVVSMYVGGTEKALEALLKESASNDSILLFDEADSIFAKRTDIRTATDRYANLETDVLLNLIERNNVFAILTTNHLEAIDYAFFRRMRFIVEFSNPDYDLRLKLWQKLIPEKLPVSSDLSIEKLASDYFFNGGDIKNVIIRAATRKAIRLEEVVEIEMNDFVEACKEIVNVKYGGKNKKIGFS